MSEIVNTFNLNNIDSLIPMKREDFYKEQVDVFKKTGEPSKAVELVNIILFNESGEFILQKRSSHKGHNANLIDKSIGGHITHGDTPDYTVMIESVQELKVPSIVLRNHSDFLKTYNLLKSYLNSISVIEHINTKITYNTKIINGEKIKIANKVHLYVGVYGGSVKNVDREAKGILFYSMDELEEELNQFPDTFTQDMHYFLEEYKDYFKDFCKTTC